MQLNRLFFALWPDETVRSASREAARQLNLRLQPGGYLSSPERYHLTLLFLGDQVLPQHERAARLAVDALRAAPFDLCFDQAGSFRNKSIPWWLGPRQVPAGLTRLQERLRESLQRAQVPVDRMRFVPHLTIARDARRVLPVTPIAPIVWPVREFVLIRSHLDRQPVEYEILQRWALEGADDEGPPPPTEPPPQLDLGF